ncbi:hypothetical protein YC2023_046841 [Brassica napus]
MTWLNALATKRCSMLSIIGEDRVGFPKRYIPPPKRLRLATIPEIVFDGSTQARNAVENAPSRGIEGAKSLLHVFEEKRTEVSSKHVGAVTNASDGASSSSTVASRDLLVSTDQSGHSI